MKEPCSTQLCPVSVTLSVIGGKWKIFILFQLRSGTKRFSALRRLIPEITQRMLTAQLRELEQAGVIRREVFAVVPPRVEYSLTALGETLTPILTAMADWGAGYQEQTLPGGASNAAAETLLHSR